LFKVVRFATFFEGEGSVGVVDVIFAHHDQDFGLFFIQQEAMVLHQGNCALHQLN
jgi:hypothetical protein